MITTSYAGWLRAICSSTACSRLARTSCKGPTIRTGAWGYYIVPSVYCWLLWQLCGAVGVFGAGVIPQDWSLEFMTTIALTVMMIPMLRERPMWVAALVGGLGAVLLRELPLRLGLIAGIALGIGAGFIAERALKGRAAR